MEISLRKAYESDVEFLVQLRAITMTRYLEDMGLSTNQEAILERVMLDYDKADIIEIDGTAVGLFKVKYQEALNQWFVVQIQVHPNFQNMKIGSQLILGLFDKAKKTGASVALGVLKTNPAQRLYYKLGFEKVGETEAEYNLEYRG